MSNDVKDKPMEERPYTMSIPACGKKYLGLSKNGSYDAADRGEIPTMKERRLEGRE